MPDSENQLEKKEGYYRQLLEHAKAGILLESPSLLMPGLKDAKLSEDFYIPNKTGLEAKLGYKVGSQKWKSACLIHEETFSKSEQVKYRHDVLFPKTNSKFVTNYGDALLSLFAARHQSWDSFQDESRPIDERIAWMEEQEKMIGFAFGQILDMGKDAPKTLHNIAKALEKMYEIETSSIEEPDPKSPQTGYLSMILLVIHSEIEEAIRTIIYPDSQDHSSSPVVYPKSWLLDAYKKSTKQETESARETVQRTLGKLGLDKLPPC